MVSGLNPIGSTPVINYKPDPGEPAVRLSAPQPQTAGLVHSQEQRNETRMRSQALASGEDILYSKKTFNLKVGQKSPVFDSGLTTLVTKPDENGFLPDHATPITPQQQRAKEEEQSPSEKALQEQKEKEQENALSTPALNELTAQEPTKEELEEEEQELETEDSRLERNLNQALMEKERAFDQGNPVEFQNARREEKQSEREIQEVEKEQRAIELDQLEARLREFQDDTESILNENLQAALGLVDVMFGMGNDQPSASRAPSSAG